MAANTLQVMINGKPQAAAAGSSVAAVVLAAGVGGFRRSATGEPRGPLCGMGICFECRVTINGRPQQKSCQITVGDGMEIITDG